MTKKQGLPSLPLKLQQKEEKEKKRKNEKSEKLVKNERVSQDMSKAETWGPQRQDSQGDSSKKKVNSMHQRV